MNCFVSKNSFLLGASNFSRLFELDEFDDSLLCSLAFFRLGVDELDLFRY